MAILTSAITTEFAYNEAAGQYINVANGQFVSYDKVKAASEAYVTKAKEDMAAISEKLKAGEINVAQWQSEMKLAIQRMNITEATLANGGWAQMSPKDWGRAGARIKKEYQFLQGFAQDVADGKYGDPITDGRFDSRWKLYGESGAKTYENTQLQNAREDMGHNRGKRVRGKTDSCSDCIEWEAEGVVNIDELHEIASSICGNNCGCTNLTWYDPNYDFTGGLTLPATVTTGA